jgi:hypothetical protein
MYMAVKLFEKIIIKPSEGTIKKMAGLKQVTLISIPAIA